MTDRIFIQGEEVRYRENSRKRTWKVGYVVGHRNQWLIVRLADGAEIEVTARNVKKIA